MIRLLAASVAGLLLFSSCNPETPKYAFRHSEKRGKLEGNGVRFVLMPDDTTQMAQVDVRWDVGSREDPPGKAGLAHVIEHLMFQPRPDGPDSPPLFQSIDNVAVGFNAFTTEDSTHYQTPVRAESVDDAIKIEAMRSFYFDTVTEVEFERERDVVRNEIRQRGGTPEGQIPQLVMSSVYPKGHAYEQTVGGDDRQLSSITLADAKEFVKKYYAPERATVIVAGGIDNEKTTASIEKWFGKLPKRTAAPRVEVKPFTVEHGTKTFELDVERPSVHVAFALPAGNTPEGEAAAYGIGNAFIRTARKAQEYDFATRVEPQILGGRLAPIFIISIELKSMKNLDEALEFVQKAAKQAYRGFDEGSLVEIEEQQNRTKADYIAGLERLGDRTVQMGDLVQFDRDVDFNSSDVYVRHELEKISKFDGERVGAAVKKYIDYDKARVVIIKPNREGAHGDTRSSVVFQKKSDEQMINPDVDPREALRPVKVAAELKSLTGAQHLTLGNGMGVILLPIHAMPLVTATLTFNNAGAASTPDSPALGAEAARFLSLPIDAEAFAQSGVSVGCQASADSATCSTGGVSIYLDVMVKGLERLVTAGEYRQQAIESWQKQTKIRLESKHEQQQLEFRRQVLTALFGPDHPYTRTGLQTPDAVSKVHKDGLDSFRTGHYTAGNATMVIVGDFEPKTAEKLIRDAFGSWGKGAVDKPVDPTPYKRTGPGFVGVIGREAPQLTVAIGYPAPAGVDGQEGARRVLAQMIQIRVDDVRFKLGTTYGVAAFRQSRKGPTAYQVFGQIDAERAGESIKAMRDNIAALRTSEGFAVDFVRARRKILSELLSESTVTSELAFRLGFITEYGLDTTYYNTLLQQVAASSPAQLKALIARELDPNNEVVVVLGDKPHVNKAFADAEIKDVKIVEPDYK